MERFIAPIFFFCIGVFALISTFNLPRSPLGNPNELLYFPLMISVMLIILSIYYFVREWKLKKEKFENFSLVKIGQTPFLLIGTIVLMIIYTLIFERAGFIISTLLFLGALLFLLNGKSRWKLNIITSVLFTFITWYSFGVLLQVSLP